MSFTRNSSFFFRSQAFLPISTYFGNEGRSYSLGKLGIRAMSPGEYGSARIEDNLIDSLKKTGPSSMDVGTRYRDDRKIEELS